MKISFNDFRAQLRTWQSPLSEGKVIELTCATNRFRQISQTVAYAVHIGTREQLPQLPILLSSTLTHQPREAIALIAESGGCIVRGQKTGDRFVLLSPELYAAIMEEKLPESQAIAQIVS